MNLKGNLGAKWRIVDDKFKVVGATVRISLDGEKDMDGVPLCDGIDDVVSCLADYNGAKVIHIFSGAHGSPGGMLQIDAPEFSIEDAKELEQDENGLVVSVFSIPFPDVGVTGQLKQSINDENIFVILAWCFSAEYLGFHHFTPGS